LVWPTFRADPHEHKCERFSVAQSCVFKKCVKSMQYTACVRQVEKCRTLGGRKEEGLAR
jgi:hypothetical protein